MSETMENTLSHLLDTWQGRRVLSIGSREVLADTLIGMQQQVIRDLKAHNEQMAKLLDEMGITVPLGRFEKL